MFYKSCMFRICNVCDQNTISEEKQTSIQIEKLKKNLKSGGAELSFLNSDEKLSTEDARENRYHADSKDDLK